MLTSCLIEVSVSLVEGEVYILRVVAVSGAGMFSISELRLIVDAAPSAFVEGSVRYSIDICCVYISFASW